MSDVNNPNADPGQPELGSPNSLDQDSDFESLTISLSSSIYEYPEWNGRTYHAYKAGLYKFPNDEQELDRLDLLHRLFYLLFDEKLFLAPISSAPHDVLDVGTGTGIWAIDFADLYPSACVTGIDLSPTQPLLVPPNCRFEIEDANDDWTFPNKFDFIHCRSLYMSAEKEKRLFHQSHNALKPGGWLEIKQIASPILCNDNTLNGTALAWWQDCMLEASGRINSPFDKPHYYQQWMEEARFVNVEKRVYSLPLNPWPKDSKLKELGAWMTANFLLGIEGFSMVSFTEVLGWSREELEVLLVEVRKDIKNRKIHAYVNLVVVIGQKPL